MKPPFGEPKLTTKKIHLESDPTKASPLSESINLVPGEQKNEFIDQETGETYFQKEDYAIEVEHFVALLCKGILHVSDMIQKDGSHYSRKMPIERISGASIEEIKAETFLLHYLFADWDHHYKDEEYKNKYVDRGDSSAEPHKNLIVGDGHAFAHFDYGMALRRTPRSAPFDYNKYYDFLFKMWTRSHLDKLLHKKFNILKMKYEFRNTDQDPHVFLKHVSEKLFELQNALNNEQFFQAVIEKSDVKLGAHPFFFLEQEDAEGKRNELRDLLLKRVRILDEIIKDYSGVLTWKKD
jgi:hypothetical protein